MPFASEWLYERLGWRYFWAYAVFEVTSAWLITAGTLGIFVLYTDVTARQFWGALVVAEIATTAGVVCAMARAKGLVRPLVEWLRAGKPASGALGAWQLAARMPRDFTVSSGWQPFLIIGLPVSAFMVIDFDLP